MALNSIQKELLDGFLKFTFDACADLKPEDGLLVLRAIAYSEIDLITRQKLEEIGMWTSVQEHRDILSHPCPQNRRVGDPTAAGGCEDGIINGKVYYWADRFGGQLKHEQQGLLGLTAKDDGISEPVSQKDVVNYILHAVYSELFKYKSFIGRRPVSEWKGDKILCGGSHTEYDEKLGMINSIVISLGKLPFPDTIHIQAPVTLEKGFLSSDKNKIVFRAHINSVEKLNLIEQKIAEDKFGFQSQHGVVLLSLEKGMTLGRTHGRIKHVFIGKDSGMIKLLDLLNACIFDNDIPFVYLNRVRSILGLELLDYKKNISYEENTGTLEQRQMKLRQLLSPYLGQTLFSGRTVEYPILKLVKDYDCSSAIDFKR